MTILLKDGKRLQTKPKSNIVTTSAVLLYVAPDNTLHSALHSDIACIEP